MSRLIKIGSNAAGPVNLDVDLLLRTHMLVQASTGGGKSHLVRLMAEQISGVSVQTIIIDPEGEFASLRHDFPFLLAGPGGDVPASPVSAAMLARKLLELRANAVLDLFELNPPGRIAFVAKFLEAMVEAPRELWHNVAIFLDEGQMFAPERSEAFSLGAVTAVATRGRKRGYGLIVATPRLSDFSKAVASQLQNVAVGPTFMDLDLQRAAIALSIAGRAEQQKFFGRLKVADPGNFIALGRAISKERVEFMSGAVVSAHPESSTDKHAGMPPPAPAAVRKLLVHLKGLEEKAETEARTVDELKAENNKLREQLAAAPADNGNQLRAAEATWTDVIEHQRGEIAMYESNLKMEREQLAATGAALLRIRDAVVGEIAALDKGWKQRLSDAPEAKTFFLDERHELPRDRHPSNGTPARTPTRQQGDGGGPGLCGRRIVSALRQRGQASRESLGIFTGYHSGGGGFRNAVSELRTLGLIEGDGEITLTPAGAALAVEPIDLKAAAVVEMWRGKLTGRARDMLTFIARSRGPVTRAAIAADVNMDMGGGGFRNYLSELQSNRLVRKTRGGFEAAPEVRLA